MVHTDSSLMPESKRAWGAWNYHVSQRGADVAVTYHLNRLQGLRTTNEYFVSLNCAERIDPGKVIRRIRYEHPVFNRHSIEAQKRHGELNGRRRTFYCGAYWRYGFHEDGVVSALTALRHFRARYEDAQRYFQRTG